MLTVMDDPIIQRIECFRCSRGTLHAERRNRGYTLYRPARWSHVCVRPDRTTGSKCSTGRSGRTGGPRQARSDAPSCRPMTHYASSPTRISFGVLRCLVWIETTSSRQSEIELAGQQVDDGLEVSG